MIRVVIVDDQQLMRSGLAALLDRDERITVVGQAADGAAGVSLVLAERPDVVLLDIRMPGVDGIEAARRIVADERLRDTRVVMLTTFDTDDHIFDAIQAGAAGFLLKDTDPDELRAAVHTVAAGDSLLSPSVTRRVLERFANDRRTPPDSSRLAPLTDRERELLTEIAAGRSNAEIAARLYLTHATTRTYVSRLLTKLNARDRAQLVHIAYESG
ncbi:response regulator, partial [Kribbella albertanoniae]